MGNVRIIILLVLLFFQIQSHFEFERKREKNKRIDATIEEIKKDCKRDGYLSSYNRVRLDEIKESIKKIKEQK